MDSKEKQTQTVTVFTFVQSSGSKRCWKLESDWAHYTEGDSVLLLPGVEVTFFEADVPATVLVGDSARVDMQDGLMQVWGNVEIDTEGRGRHLSSPEIEWREETGMFHSDSFVVLTDTVASGVTVYSGVGIDIDTNLDVVDSLDIRDAFTAEYTENENVQ